MNWKVEFTLGYGPATRANEFQLPGRGGGIAFRHRGISISHNRLRTFGTNTKREWSLLCKVILLFYIFSSILPGPLNKASHVF